MNRSAGAARAWMIAALLVSSACTAATERTQDGPTTWIGIHAPVSDDFLQALETRTSHDRAAWRRELAQHYRTDGRLVYRGMCDDASRTLEDLARTFVSVDIDLASQAIVSVRQQAMDADHPIDWTRLNFDLRRSIFADLSRYNRDAWDYALYRSANIHQLGPVAGNATDYEYSYGFSTSWSFVAAAEFSGVYPGDAPCANSIVFALYPGRHYVDFAALDAVDYRFVQAYPSEREVMGVGAVDPDAVMIVSRIRAAAGNPPEIVETLLRDPTRPDRLLYFQGGLDGLARDIDAGWALVQADQARVREILREHHVRPALPPSVPGITGLSIRPDAPLEVRVGGAAPKPARVIALDYDSPLFPPPPPRQAP